MGSFSITHWLILLVVVVLVFGTSKLKSMGKDVGSAVKDFKESVKSEQADDTNLSLDQQPSQKNHSESHTTDTKENG